MLLLLDILFILVRGGTTLYLEFPFWKLPLLIVSAFKGVNFQKRLFTPPLGDILGPFNWYQSEVLT